MKKYFIEMEGRISLIIEMNDLLMDIHYRTGKNFLFVSYDDKYRTNRRRLMYEERYDGFRGDKDTLLELSNQISEILMPLDQCLGDCLSTTIMDNEKVSLLSKKMVTMASLAHERMVAVMGAYGVEPCLTRSVINEMSKSIGSLLLLGTDRREFDRLEMFRAGRAFGLSGDDYWLPLASPTFDIELKMTYQLEEGEVPTITMLPNTDFTDPLSTLLPIVPYRMSFF